MHHITATLLDRATSEARRGEWRPAIRTCEEIYRRSIQLKDQDSLLEALTRLGDYYRQAGEFDLATEHLELALTVAELQNSAPHSGRALNVLAIIEQHKGNIDAAEAMYIRAREVSLGMDDKKVLGWIEQNLGILANIRGNLSEARARYLAGLAYLREARHDRGCAQVLNNLGMLHVDLGELDRADAYFEDALEICEQISDVFTAGIVHLNRTELFLARDEPLRARASCDEAFETFSRIGEEEGRSEAMKFYGIIHRTMGKPHLAETYLRQAIQIAAANSFPLVEAESQREFAFVLLAQGRNREALEVLNRAHSLFNHLQATHDQADVNQKISKLEDDFLTLVRSWGESIEAKDRYTSGHCQRVADYACRIAEEVGISEREVTWFRMGAFLHDVGKTEVPAEILNKPGRLTDEERRTMERHTVIGDEILSPVEFPWDIRPMVRSHHERWDGAGYPDGLREEAIPYTARILRIADIFDALTTARSYRKPLTPEEAFRIMEEDHGSFDPELFETFRALFPELAERARAVHLDSDSPVPQPA